MSIWARDPLMGKGSSWVDGFSVAQSSWVTSRFYECQVYAPEAAVSARRFASGEIVPSARAFGSVAFQPLRRQSGCAQSRTVSSAGPGTDFEPVIMLPDVTPTSQNAVTA